MAENVQDGWGDGLGHVDGVPPGEGGNISGDFSDWRGGNGPIDLPVSTAWNMAGQERTKDESPAASHDSAPSGNPGSMETPGCVPG